MPYCSNCGRRSYRASNSVLAAELPVSLAHQLQGHWRHLRLLVLGLQENRVWQDSGWARYGLLIDALAVALVTGLPLHFLQWNYYLALLISTVITFIYAATLIAWWDGQTIGMNFVKVRCVDGATRRSASSSQAAIRAAIASGFTLLGSAIHPQTYAHPTPQQVRHVALVVMLGGLLSIPRLLDYLWPAWDKRSQTLHDKVAGTIVIRDASPRTSGSLGTG